jgi:hypothetical protein
MKRGVQIEGVQPIIESGAKPGRPYKYPFDALKVGQTFWVNGASRPYVNLYVAVWRRNRANLNQKFALTKGVKNEKHGYRIQRTK